MNKLIKGHSQWDFFMRHKIITVILALVIIGSISSAMSGGNKNGAAATTPNNNATSTTSSNNSNSVSSTPAKPAFNFATSSLTQDNIKNGLSNTIIKDKITDIKIDGSNITITVNDKNALDEKYVIRTNKSESASVFEDLFKNKNVNQITYSSAVPVTDKFGKESTIIAISGTLTKDNADKVDWKNFKNGTMEQYYGVVDFQLANESQISGFHKAWADLYAKE